MHVSLTIFNFVGGVIEWGADIYKYASNTIYTIKLLYRTNNKPRKLVDKLLKWLDCTEPTFISNVIVQSHNKCQRFIKIFFGIFDDYCKILFFQ